MQRRQTGGLAAVLFTDIVGSTEIATELGDRRWRELIRRHHAAVRQQLKRYHGRENDTAGDGFFATFDRPADAIRAAAGAIAGVRGLGIEIRAGVSFGEVERHEGKAGGLVVVTAARVMSVAGPGEILVPAAVADLIPGSGIRFGDRGRHTLKGIDGEVVVRTVLEIDGAPLGSTADPTVARERRDAIHPPPIHRRRGVAIAVAAAVGLGAVAGVAALLGDGAAPEDGLPALGAEWEVIAIDPEDPAKAVATVSPGDWGPLRGQEQSRVLHTVVVGEQSVFVQRKGCAVQIDPKLGDVRNRLCPGGDIAVGFRRLWVTVGEEVRGADLYTGDDLEPIRVRDPASVDQAILRSADRIATGLGAVWVGFADGYLSRYDPASDEITIRRVSEEIDSLAVGAGVVWMGDRFHNSITTFDPRTGAIRQIDLGIVTPDEIVFDVALGKVWALDTSSDLLVAIDRDGPGRAITVGADPTDIAVGGGSVWVGDLDGVLREVDPTIGRVREVVDVGQPIWALGVDEETELVWLDLSPPPRRSN